MYERVSLPRLRFINLSPLVRDTSKISRHPFLEVYNGQTIEFCCCKQYIVTHVLEGAVLHHEHDDMFDVPEPDCIGGGGKNQ
jgi:hypothetical protein